MVDRSPTYPGRVKLTLVAGTTDKFDMEMADEPTEAGTPLNKANLLTDATASVIDSVNPPAVPDAAFNKIATKLNAMPTSYCEVVQYLGTGMGESISPIERTTYTYSSKTYYSEVARIVDKTITFSREPKAVVILNSNNASIASCYYRPTASGNMSNSSTWWMASPLIFNFQKPSSFPLSDAKLTLKNGNNTYQQVQMPEDLYNGLYYSVGTTTNGISGSYSLLKNGNTVQLLHTDNYADDVGYDSVESYMLNRVTLVNNSDRSYTVIAFY